VEFSLSLTYTFSIDGAKQHNTLKFNVTNTMVGVVGLSENSFVG
jgi:hypothetical protein